MKGIALCEFDEISEDCNSHAKNYISVIKENDTNYLYDELAADNFSSPMQPLALNLCNGTYASFEEDPVKYKLYQEAIRRALSDKVGNNNSHTINVMILGAGRGPIVRAAFEASKAIGCKIKIIVVEKNVTIMPKLEQTIAEVKKRGAKIFLFKGYMQSVKVPDRLKADIFVSELLGAFGCNELSPECLDGAELNGLLKPDGISIPESYESWIRPIMSWRLVDNLRTFCKKRNFSDLFWTVNNINFVVIDEHQLLWKFEHPQKKRDQDELTNVRRVSLEFVARDDVVLHGFAGYFSTTLYKDIEFNIVPNRHTEQLISWWPNFFPVKTFQVLRNGEPFSVTFERKIDDIKVWYEWTVDSFETSNVNGLWHPLARSMEVVKCVNQN